MTTGTSVSDLDRPQVTAQGAAHLLRERALVPGCVASDVFVRILRLEHREGLRHGAWCAL